MNVAAPALEKGLLILEHILAVNEPVTLSGVAEAVGFKVSEIQRMVGYLAEAGYIVKTASGTYTPGARAYSLADRKLESAVIAKSEGPMRRYVARSGASVHIGSFVGEQLHIVYEVEGTGDVRVCVRPGLYDAGSTPSGRLFLAFQLEGTESDTPAFKDIRAKGVSSGELDCAVGVYIVAVPVPIGANPCAVALATPYLRKAKGDPHFREDLVAELHRCATEISAQF
jgi:DNA-binding IclR family transcriptional regulator